MVHIFLETLGRGSAAALLLALASLVGLAFLPRAARPPAARERLPLALAFGILILGSGVWAVGSLLGTWAAWPLVLLLSAAACRKAGAWWRDVRRMTRELTLLVRAEPLAALLALVPVALVLPQLATPLWDSDGIRYHVAFPKLFLLTGRVFLYPWDVTGAFPQTAEMLDLLLLPLVGGEGAKLLHAGFFLAVLATLALLVHRSRATRRAAMLAPFLLAAAPVFLVPVPSGFVEQAALFPLVVAALLLVRRRTPWAVGVALAAAVMTKWTVLPAVAGLALAGIVRAPRGRRSHTTLALLLPAAIAFAPLGVRNAVVVGDPAYPAVLGLLGKPIPGVSAERLRWATRYHDKAAPPLGVHFLNETGKVQPDEVAGFHHLVGLFALLLAVKERRLRPLLMLLVPYLLLSIPFRPPTRYLVPGFLALAAYEAEALARFARRLAIPLAAAAAAPALAGSAAVLLSGPVLPYLGSRIDRATFLTASIPGWRAAGIVNSLPPGGSVMALDFPGPFYFDRPWIAEGVLTEPPLARWLREGLSGEQVLRRLQELQVRYLVVTPGYGGGTNASLFPLATSKESARALVDLRARLRLVGRVDRVDVFEVPIDPPGPGRSPLPSGPRSRR